MGSKGAACTGSTNVRLNGSEAVGGSHLFRSCVESEGTKKAPGLMTRGSMTKTIRFIGKIRKFDVRKWSATFHGSSD